MKLAMALYHYFPYGGLQRDFARIAREAVSRGHEVVALVSDWQGETIDGVTVQRIHVSGGSNHGRMRSFARGVLAARATGGFDRVVGFNRLPGLDVYFAADSCFAEHLSSKPIPVRWLPRYASYLKLEQAVTAANGPLILFLNDDQRDQYLRHYPLAANRYALCCRRASRGIDNGLLTTKPCGNKPGQAWVLMSRIPCCCFLAPALRSKGWTGP